MPGDLHSRSAGPFPPLGQGSAVRRVAVDEAGFFPLADLESQLFPEVPHLVLEDLDLAYKGGTCSCFWTS